MINKLYKYLLNIGAVDMQRGPGLTGAAIEIKKATYGDYGYFYNAPGCTYEAINICFDYNVNPEIAGKEYFKNLIKVEHKIRKYAARYGYVIFNEGSHTWGHYMAIASRRDHEKANDYFNFRDRAINEVDLYIHNASINHTPVIDSEIRAIMDRHGDAYNEFLKATEAA